METKCASCGINTECVSVCGAFGAMTYSCCLKCLAEGREPYRNIVNYISSAGHWPQDINPIYREEVKRQLKLHNIPEEVFRFEVEREIAEEQVRIINLSGGRIEF